MAAVEASGGGALRSRLDMQRAPGESSVALLAWRTLQRSPAVTRESGGVSFCPWRRPAEAPRMR